MKTTIATLATWSALAAAAAGGDATLRIYLLRNVKAGGEEVKLADLAVVLSDDVKLEGDARAVAMGRTPWPGESLAIDRMTILSRLATCGIERQCVRFIGAEKATVTRDEKTVTTEELLEAAEKFLQDCPLAKDPKGCIFQVVRKPQELVVPGSGDLECTCKLDETTPAQQVRVVVTAHRNGRQLGLREVLYKQMHPVHSAVVTRPIPAGGTLTEENIEIQTDYRERPEAAGWKAPYGLLAARRLSPGTVVRPSLTAEKKPDLVILRSQMVRMRVEGPGFAITGVGQALEEGRPGEYIKVRNVDSQRVITALVAFDGVVEPVFKR